MSTLWIFGDSFCSEVDLNSHENNNSLKYMNYMGVDKFDTWSNLLSKKLNFELKNLACGGSSNYQIFQDFCEVCHLIKPNDIVIVGWGLVSKFRISIDNKFENIHPNNLKDYDNISKDTLEDIVSNRLNVENKDFWAHEVYSWEVAMNNLSNNKGYKIFFWSTEENRLIYRENILFKDGKKYLCKDSQVNLIQHLKELGCTSISDDTNNLVGDSHFGINGHKKQSEIFYDEIMKYNNE